MENINPHLVRSSSPVKSFRSGATEPALSHGAAPTARHASSQAALQQASRELERRLAPKDRRFFTSDVDFEPLLGGAFERYKQDEEAGDRDETLLSALTTLPDTPSDGRCSGILSPLTPLPESPTAARRLPIAPAALHRRLESLAAPQPSRSRADPDGFIPVLNKKQRRLPPQPVDSAAYRAPASRGPGGQRIPRPPPSTRPRPQTRSAAKDCASAGGASAASPTGLLAHTRAASPPAAKYVAGPGAVSFSDCAAGRRSPSPSPPSPPVLPALLPEAPRVLAPVDRAASKRKAEDSETGAAPPKQEKTGQYKNRHSGGANKRRRKGPAASADGDVEGCAAPRVPPPVTAGRRKHVANQQNAKRQEKKAMNAGKPAFAIPPSPHWFEKEHDTETLPLPEYTVKYDWRAGAYDADFHSGGRVYTLKEVRSWPSFKEVIWDPVPGIAILDKKRRCIVAAMGQPKDAPGTEGESFDQCQRAVARTCEKLCCEHAKSFGSKNFHNKRGKYFGCAIGCCHGGGRVKPGPIALPNEGQRKVAERLLADKRCRRLARNTDAGFRYYFPKVYKHAAERVETVLDAHPECFLPYQGCLYPAWMFNLGPATAMYMHADGKNYPGIPCCITPLGDFDPDEGGHLILFDLKLYIKLLPGCTIYLSSAGLRHGNTAVPAGQRRYSMTGFMPGAMIRWAAFGCKPISGFDKKQRKLVEKEMGEGSDAQVERYSVWEKLHKDRKILEALGEMA